MTPKSIAQFVQWFWLASKLPQEPKDGQHHFQGSFVDPLTPEVHDDKYSNALQDIQWAGAVILDLVRRHHFQGSFVDPFFFRTQTLKKTIRSPPRGHQARTPRYFSVYPSLPPPKKLKNGSQKYGKKPYEVHLEVTRLERHAIFRRSISLDDVDCF